MSDAEDDLDFELVTSASMLADAPPLRKERVLIPGLKTRSGKPAGLLVWELSANDWGACRDAGWEYRNGVRHQFNDKDEDVRFLSWTVRDPHGNRLWNTVADAKGQLGKYGRSALVELIRAANRVNAPKEGSSEGNSEEIQSDS